MKLKKINNQLLKFPIQIIQTPTMKLLFQPNTLYNNIVLKIEFHQIKTNICVQDCLESIINLELEIFNEVKRILNNQELILKSQIIQNKQYNPYLLAKVVNKKTKFNYQTELNSTKYDTILMIPKSTLMKLTIYCDNVWITNQNQVIIKWKIKNLFC